MFLLDLNSLNGILIRMKHLNITISGKVHGVFFRMSTKAVADQLGVKGIIKNQKDGTIFIEAEGDDFSLENFMEYSWCFNLEACDSARGIRHGGLSHVDCCEFMHWCFNAVHSSGDKILAR